MSITTCDLDSGQVLRVEPMTQSAQITMGCDSVLYVSNNANTTLNSINPSTGALNTGNSFPSFPASPIDLAEWISQPC